MNLMRGALAGVLVLAAGAAPAQTPAGGYDSSLYAGLSWRNIGPIRGGRSQAISGSAARPYEYYFGAVGGGLWKTTDGGTTWNPVTDGQIRSSSVGAVAVAPSNPDIVYIGMGETELRGNIMQGDGVYRSADGGKTWEHRGLEQTQAIARMRVDPANPDLVYVAALGHPFGPNAERGIFRSRDGGASWQKVLFRNDSTGAIDIAIDPNDPRTLYATFWQVYRTPWKMWGGGPGSGLFKSTDGGDHWTELTRNPGMPTGIIGKIGVSVSGANSRRVYAIVEADSGGVFRSDDGGATWKRTNADRKIRQRSFYYSRIVADPKLPDRVYALNVGFYRSDDGGVTFDTTINVPHGDNHDLWISPDDSRRLAESNDGGGTISVNAGKTWTDLDFPTAQSYRVTTTADFPYHVCGAQQDNSTFCVPSDDWSNLAGANDRQGDWFYEIGGGESGYIASNPDDPNIFYAGSQGALITRYDRRTGQIRDVQVKPRFFSGEPASALPERWQWTFPIIFSPQNSRVLYTTSQHLWKSTDEGQSWTRISPDLTRADPSTLGPTGGPITMDMNGPEIYGTIFTVAPSRHDSLTIWTGSDDGLVYLTRDGGRTWKNITPPDLPPFSRISLIDASPHRAGSAYLAAKRYQLDDRAPYIFITDDYGAHWRKAVAGIRADDYVHAVKEDPVREHLLYAGTEHGVWVSFDDGAHWQPLSLKLPDTQVPDLVVEQHDLVIATHGRSMYVLDDIEPLRQMRPEYATAPLHLYRPHVATRGVDEAIFQYQLGSAADSVRVEVLDSAGAVIRSFTGIKRAAGDTARADDDDDDSGCDTRRRTPAMPPTKQGLNRFTWDLRYPGATTFPCMIIWSARPQSGPKAPPGRYQVRVIANGQAQTQLFEIRRDPRLNGITDRDLAEQFRLASDIRDRTSAANEAVIRIREVRDSVRARVADARGSAAAAVRREGMALDSALTTVEEALYQTKNRSGQDPLNFPIRLNNRLASLRRSVETGDAKPTAGAYEVFRDLSAELDRHLSTLETLLSKDLTAYNRTLQRSGMPRIVLAAGPRV